MLIKHAIRPVVVALAALAVGASSAVALPALDADATSDATRAVIDLTGEPDGTTTLQAASVPAASTGIGPGAPLRIEIEGDGTYGCTASWIFTDGADLLLGAAGHCFLPLDVATTHEDGAEVYDRSRTTVSVCVVDCEFGGISSFLSGGYVELGPLVYARQESASGEQVGWDFGVAEIPAELEDLVRTTMPVFGGPTDAVEMVSGDQVCHYGNGVAVGEVFLTKARSGLGLFAEPDAWFAATAAAPGDSGSALQTCATTADGFVGEGAVGTLTHITLAGIAGTTDARSIELAATDADLALDLVLGAVPAIEDPTDPGGSTDDGSTDDRPRGRSGDAPRQRPQG
jgi:hypothetical protein